MKYMLSGFVNVRVLCFYDENVSECKVQDAFVGNLEVRFKNVKFERISVNREREMAEKYEIKEIPSIVIESNGEVKEKFNGLTQELFLRKAIEKVTNL